MLTHSGGCRRSTIWPALSACALLPVDTAKARASVRSAENVAKGCAASASAASNSPAWIKASTHPNDPRCSWLEIPRTIASPEIVLRPSRKIQGSRDAASFEEVTRSRDSNLSTLSGERIESEMAPAVKPATARKPPN